MVPPFQPAMDLQQRRQRARNQEQIIEPEPKEWEVREWFKAPPVQRVEPTTRQTKRIQRVTEFFHRSARMAKPKPNAKRIFNDSTSIWIR